MSRHATLALSMVLLLSLLACGGAEPPAEAPRKALQGGARPVAPPTAAYTGLMQNIYLAYFGRPADPGGLAFWSEQYRNAGAPTNIVDLNTAYQATPAIQDLLDIFGTSQESQDLYPGDNADFITAIYHNMLSRSPDAAGKAYWVGLLDQRAITRPGAAIAIMAGARASDLEIIARKVAVASSFTTLLNTPERSKGYDGMEANVMARDMLRKVGAATDADAFQPSIEATVQTLAATPAKDAMVFAGTLATGRPISNAAITIEDVEGAYAEASTGALGGFIIDMGVFVRLGQSVAKLKPPFFLHAKYTEDGQARELHSVTTAPATGPVQVNVTPVTDAVARGYAWPVALDGRAPKQQAGAAPLGVPSDADKLERVKNNLKAMYGDLAAGVGDPVRDRFVPDPNSSPMDAMLERTRTVVKDGVVVISDAAGNPMARAAVARLSGAALPASDAETVSALEARAAVANRGAFASTTAPLQSGASAVIDSVSPATANVDEATRFTVSGKGLGDSLVFNLSGCEGIAALPGGSSVARQYSCTPRAAGPQEGLIKTAPGGGTLYVFHVAVKKFQPPIVVSFGPSYADLGGETLFRIRGNDLTNGMRLVINGCSPVREVDSGEVNGVSSTMREFACAPTIAGTQNALIYDQSGVTLVASFPVLVSAKGKPTITSYTPDATTLYNWTRFTFKGNDLPAGMAVDLDGCIGMTEQGGGSASERHFSCTTMSSGTLVGTVRDKANGTLLKTFTVKVADADIARLPVVTGYSPGEATLNQSTVFTFTGTDLAGAMGFSLDGCINVRELAGGTGSQRRYSCTPTVAGPKSGVINGQTFSVTVSGGAGSGSGTGTGTRATGSIIDESGVVHPITLKLLPSDGIGTVCGKTLYSYFSTAAKPLPRIFNCDGTGSGDMYSSDKFVWGFAVSDSDKTKLQIKSFKEWQWEYNPTNDPAVLIYFKYTNGSDAGKVFSGIIGITNGKVRNGFGYGFYEK